jgi:hypothetical protein
VVERILGKDEVMGSIPIAGSTALDSGFENNATKVAKGLELERHGEREI